MPFGVANEFTGLVYLLASSCLFLTFFLFKIPAMKKYTLAGLYISFSVVFMFSIYLSVIQSPHMRATILLGIFCLTPLGFVDTPNRIASFIGFWFVAHSLLAYYLKPDLAFADMTNSLAFSIIGCFLGNIMIRVRLESYEAYRLLMIEKETDAVTGLFNRHKLTETLEKLAHNQGESPSGVLMIDIDYFKAYNDKFGHSAGDKCLSSFGEVLLKFSKNFRIDFYRYGGEEFLGFAYGYNANELYSIAESLRIAVQTFDMGGRMATVSIGVAYCGDEQVQNYETVINRADKAVYAAKAAGRNTVCMEQKGV